MLLIFVFFFLTFANATLIIDIPSQYSVKVLDGNISYKNSQLEINGKGTIKFLKNDLESNLESLEDIEKIRILVWLNVDRRSFELIDQVRKSKEEAKEGYL